jgi:hypothetical protein
METSCHGRRERWRQVKPWIGGELLLFQSKIVSSLGNQEVCGCFALDCGIISQKLETISGMVAPVGFSPRSPPPALALPSKPKENQREAVFVGSDGRREPCIT